MKKIEVVLIVPPSETFRQAEEHLGTGYLSAVLKKRGLSCKIIDGFLCPIGIEDIKREILSLRPKVVGFSPYQDSLKSFSEIATFVRDRMPSTHITAGGFLASFNYEWLLSSLSGILDSIVVGEGELTFAELAEKVISERDWRDSDTKGIVFTEGHRIIKLPMRGKISNLDLLPFPDRSTLRATVLQKNPVHICTSRGCYGNCSFCSVNSFCGLNSGNKWRSRSVENVVDEIEFLVKDYGIGYFKLIDDCFFPSKNKAERAESFCRELDKRGLKIKFRLSCRVNDVERDTFLKLKNHGLFSVSLGVESVVARQLQEWRKGVTPKQNVAALEICHKLGIIVQMGYIMLDRDSTVEELRQHLDFLSQHDYAVTKGIYSSVFAAEGTELTENYRKEDRKAEKSGINLDYGFRYKEVSEIADALRKWSKLYGDTYSWAIDSLSAPKAISASERQKIHKLVTILKRKELEVLEDLIGLAEKNKIVLVERHIDRKIRENHAFMEAVENSLTNFYEKNGLPRRRGINPYLR